MVLFLAPLDIVDRIIYLMLSSSHLDIGIKHAELLKTESLAALSILKAEFVITREVNLCNYRAYIEVSYLF